MLGWPADRARASRLERDEPLRFRWGGANDWQNSSIESFLEAAMAMHEPAGGAATWRWFAEFL